jgi:hypothetical protein
MLEKLFHPGDVNSKIVARANDTPEIRAIIESLADLEPPSDPCLWGNFIVTYGTRAQISVLEDGQAHLLPNEKVHNLRPSERLVAMTDTASESTRLEALERIAAAIVYAGLVIDAAAMNYTSAKIGEEIEAVGLFLDNGTEDLKVDFMLGQMPLTMRVGIKDMLNTFPTPPLLRRLES